jgi:uncharacterized protein
MSGPQAAVVIPAELRSFLRAGRRAAVLAVGCDGVSSLGHVVESLGVPLTEVGGLLVNGEPAAPAHRPVGGDLVEVLPVARPQRLAAARFVLDVHLGTVARRLRLVGLDCAYANDRDDDALIAQASAERRVLLTQDRGLLRRRSLWFGAYVRGARPDEQFADVLDRFAPPLAPWTRCMACNGPLVPVSKADVDAQLLPGTRRSYEVFARCAECSRVYWHGAHSGHLEEIVQTAMQAAAAGRAPHSALTGDRTTPEPPLRAAARGRSRSPRP